VPLQPGQQYTLQQAKDAVKAQLGQERDAQEVATRLDAATDWDECVVALMALTRDELIRIAELVGPPIPAQERRRIAKTRILERLHTEVFRM
jgi:hypothetical protein